MRRLLRILIRVTVLSALIVGGILFARTSQLVPTPPESNALSDVLDEATVALGDIALTVSATGSLAPARQLPLTFEITAPVVEIAASAGQFVEAGELIARVDATDLIATVEDAEIALEFQQLAFAALTAPPREVDIAVAEAAVTAAQASFNAAFQSGNNANQVEIARLQAELARNQLWQAQLQAEIPAPSLNIALPPEVPPEVQEVINELISGISFGQAGVPGQSQRALEQLEFGIQIADANFASAQGRGPDFASLNSANAARTQAQIALDRLTGGPDETRLQQTVIDLQQAELALEQARNLLSRAELRAPFDGVLVENNLTVGQLPPQGVSVLLMDLSRYYLDLPVDETDIVQVAVGQPVEVLLDAFPGETFTARVTRVSQTPTRVGQLVTYLVQVELDPTDRPLRIGMSATARITTRQVDNVPILRNSFIRIDRATRRAFVTVERAPGRFSEVEVTLGVRNETFSEITSGLSVGDRVVLRPRTSNPFGFGGN